MQKTRALLILSLLIGNCNFLLSQNCSTDASEYFSASPLMMFGVDPTKKSKDERDQHALELAIQERERQATEPDHTENQKLTKKNPDTLVVPPAAPDQYSINRTVSSLKVVTSKVATTALDNRKSIISANSTFTIYHSPEHFEAKFKNRRTIALQMELQRIKQAQIVHTQIAKKEKWIQFITTITKLGKMLAENKYSFIRAAQRFNSNEEPSNTRIENMKSYLSQLKQRIETTDTQHANLTGDDATQIKNNLLFQIDLTKQMLDDLNYNFVIGSGVAGAAGYAIPAAIHAAFCKSAIPLSLICPAAVPFTLAAGTIAAIGSYAYLKEGRAQLYRQSLSEMEATTANIRAIRERNRSRNITVEHTANLALWLTTELTQFTRTLRETR